MKAEDIISWLSQPEFEVSRSPTTILGKLPDHNQQQPLSPPQSRKRHHMMADDSHPTPKRQRVERDATGLDETPRASSSRGGLGSQPSLQMAPPGSLLPPASASQSIQSQPSGRSSPSKQMAALELDPGGINTRALSLVDPRLPPALSSLLKELERCHIGIGVISSSLQAEIDKQTEDNPRLGIFATFMFAAPADRDQFGPTLSLDDAVHLVQEATECQVTMQSEVGWNMMVHYPLLFKAIHGQGRQNQLVDIAPCTTARLIKEYLPTNSQAKTVDFCIYLTAELNDAARDATERLRRVLPCNVINHTEFFPLRDRPIAVSIETKKKGGSQSVTAELQLGTWHAAQWKFLEDLVARSGGSFDGLPFLPAVIVRGHDWSFVATTREGPKTVLWLEKGFGSTTSPLDVYKTVWGIQRLARWAKEVYWPWFMKNALGVPE
ncbi:hypothetical protein AK830_g12100 [Neonectria ditissima]|uniref:PD-(D/E)XK nuclease-like domain-containing protein n=1 Tax=Neonectria ditissima TaxID=78410 RepID=A0A0P7AQ36_9HYPO|nr:hypothetical protein AK830_g12100 [Neonectria ditissima]